MYQQATTKPKHINPYIPTLKGNLRIPVDCIAWERKITTGDNTGLTYINYFDDYYNDYQARMDFDAFLYLLICYLKAKHE